MFSRRALVATLLLLVAGHATAFDHQYRDDAALLHDSVHWSADGHASSVDYRVLKARAPALQQTLASFSAVTPAAFAQWSREQQMAFLINAYNGFTLSLVTQRYPDLQSIRDLGSWFRSPWQQPFFSLLGEPRTLDWIEHEQLRARYHDRRIHFAVNCASIGCPALRPTPYTAEQLSEQLDDQQRRFLGDRTRNRFDPATGVLSVSSIFKWYRDDFDAGGQGLSGWLATQAALLADDPASRARIGAGDFSIRFLDYDWRLNSTTR